MSELPSETELAVNAAAHSLAAFLDAHPEPGYVNTAVSDDGSGLVLALAHEPSDRLREAVAAVGGPVPIAFRRVRHSAATLQEVQDRVSADREQWRERGIAISRCGADWSSNTVEISLVGYSPGAAEQLRSTYGHDLVTVEERDRPYARRC